MNQDKESAPSYQQEGFTKQVIETEKLWRLINFMSCVHRTKFVKKLVWNPEMRASKQHYPFDDNCRLLSKLLKCITFVQDLNQCTKISEVLGDKVKYILSKDFGRPIFTGSTEEGLALFGHQNVDSTVDFDRLNYRLLHDIDIMYESHKMVAYEIDSMLLTLFDTSGVLRAFIRPGKKAGYVTLQKLLPSSAVVDTPDTMVKRANVYPKPEEYDDQESVALVYISVLAFLIAAIIDFFPQECSCYSATEQGLDPNRYGDLCHNCKRLTLREIPRGEGISSTKIWADQIRIRGPVIQENGIIENTSDPFSATAPMNDTEYTELCAKRRRGKERDVEVLQTVQPDLSDIFSLPDRTKFFVEHVPAVKCGTWPSAAWEFMVRERPSGWPPKNVVQEIVAAGCHVIPKSTKPHPETRMKQVFHCISNTAHYIDWRLSFSMAEKSLISTWNMAQVKCYMLLKIFDIIATRVLFREKESKGNLPDEPFCLNTYLLKTTFFWVCEEIPLEEWSDDNLGACFLKVVEKLIMFLEKATIPNYFVPSSNLIVPNEINPETTAAEASELASCFEMFRAKSSQDIFAILHTAVWHELWECSEVVPPGSTPPELMELMKALTEEQRETWNEHRPKSEYQASKRDKSEDLKVETNIDDNVESLGDPSVKHHGQSKDTVSFISSNISTATATATATDDQLPRDVSGVLFQQISEQILAQIFSAMSKFLYANGNIHGKGFNTVRAAFYEDEARKLLPEGCSLDDIPEWTLSSDSN